MCTASSKRSNQHRERNKVTSTRVILVTGHLTDTTHVRYLCNLDECNLSIALLLVYAMHFPVLEHCREVLRLRVCCGESKN